MQTKISSNILFSRYLQSVDLSGGSAFELPQYHTLPNKDDCSTLISQNLPDSWKDPLSRLGSTTYLTKACQVDDAESHYLEIPCAEKANPQNSFIMSDFLPFTPACDAELSGLYLVGSTQEEQVSKEDVNLQLSNEQMEHQSDAPHLYATDEKYTQIENLKDMPSLNENDQNEYRKQAQNCQEKVSIQDHERTITWSNLTDNVMPLIPTRKEQSVESLDASQESSISHPTSLMYSSISSSHSQFTEQTVPESNSSLQSHYGMVVAIDNSNIYIGAQECASMVNPGDRKRHVRVKLQNLVRILEKERTKTRGFACGSSPPATEHVWEVYR